MGGSGLTIQYLSEYFSEPERRKFNRAEIERELGRMHWVPIEEANMWGTTSVKLYGLFEAEPGGLVRPKPGTNGRMRFHDTERGVPIVRLEGEGVFGLFALDQLVAAAFYPPPIDEKVLHTDRKPSNCAADNLEWDIRSHAGSWIF